MRKLTIYIFISIGVSMLSCKTQQLPYDFDSPVESLQLKKELNEISGLDWISDSMVACIQDEKAEVYFLNTNTGKVESSFDFGHNGDFEGIAVDSDTIYILRSDGHIFVSIDQKKATEYKFKNDEGFDFEGICLDRANNRLLVACKEHGSKKKRDSIFVYAFSIGKSKYEKDPVFKILKDDIHPNFKPSGIALHPNGDIYILSSFSKTLLVLNPDGTKNYQTQLSGYIYHQPEGICFDKLGNIFISNEKNKTQASLLKIKNKGK